MSTYSNDHTKVKKWIFPVTFQGNRFNFGIVSNDILSCTLWAIQLLFASKIIWNDIKVKNSLFRFCLSRWTFNLQFRNFVRTWKRCGMVSNRLLLKFRWVLKVCSRGWIHILGFINRRKRSSNLVSILFVRRAPTCRAHKCPSKDGQYIAEYG